MTVNGKRWRLLFLLGCLFFLSPKQLKAEDYIIGAEDVLNISVWEASNLDLKVSVRPDGKISFPLIGEVQAAGLTPIQIKELVTEKLHPYIKDPVVTVIVVEITSPKVYLLGEIIRPGTYILKKNTTVLELLSNAGGLTEQADSQGAYLLRNKKKILINLYELLEKGDDSHNVLLIPGDEIFVPNNFPKRITVLGEVKTPKVITFKEGLTVLDAVLMAGGLTEYADPKQVKIIRKEGENVIKLQVNLKAVMKEGNIEQNLLLMPGDTIVIEEKWI